MRSPVRLRLALAYGALFLVAGVVLVILINVLVVYSPFPVAPPAGAPPGAAGTTETAVQSLPGGTVERVLVNSVIALGLTGLVAVLLGWVMAGRALRPVAAMTATVRGISADRLDRRLALPGPADELKQLADTFDELLDRLQAAFTAQRRFIANASHELRTPVTLQQTLAEVALSDPGADAAALRAALERMLAAGQHQGRLIEALLTLARSHQGLQQRQPVDLAQVTRTALAQRTPPGLRTQSSLRPAPTAGDPRLLERLVANLLDNAFRHNTPDGWITVATDTADGRATLQVSNSGPVIAAADVPTLLEPFQHPGSRRRSSGDGLGLGLSIVSAIVEAHRGTLDVRPRPEGGLDVTVVLPP